MDSVSLSRPTNPPRWSAWFWWPLLMLPYALLAESMLRQHYLSNISAFLLEKTYLIVATGRLESIGFSYPPLPFLLLLPGHSPAWMALVSVATVSLLATLLLRELLRTNINRWLIVLIASSIFFNPDFMRLATEDLPDLVGFLFLFLSFVNYEKYVRCRNIMYAFRAGLWLSAAFLGTPAALYFLPVFVILLPFFSPDYPRRELLAAASVLAFPTAATIGIWAYLSWLFLGHVVLAYPALYFHKVFFVDWLWAAPIYWGTALLLARSPLRLLVHLVPLIMIVFSPTLGLASNAAVVALFTLFAIAGMPRRVSMQGHAILLIAVILQVLVAVPNIQHLLVDSRGDEATRVNLAVSAELARAPIGSVLTNDSQTYKLIALAGTAKPFLLPADSHYAIAALQPAKFCPYLLVGDTPETDLYEYMNRAPHDMVLEARFGNYLLYRRRDAPPLLSAP